MIKEIHAKDVVQVKLNKLMLINCILAVLLLFIGLWIQFYGQTFPDENHLIMEMVRILFRCQLLLMIVNVIYDIYQVKRKHVPFPTMHIVLYPACGFAVLYAYFIFAWTYSIVMGGFHQN